MPYPDPKEIRERLMSRVGHGGSLLDVRQSFLNHGLHVCEEADMATVFPDTQTIAKLQFIERVLNG